MKSRLLLGALIASVTLTACGGDPSPAPAPTSSSAAPSASPTPTPPALPAAATKRTPAGAKAYLRHFFKAMVFAGDSGDTTYFRSLYAPQCRACEGIADGIDHTYEAGGFMKGGAWVATRMVTYGFDGNRFPIDVELTSQAQRFKTREDAPVHQVKRANGRVHYFALTWMKSKWLVSELDKQS